MTKKETLEKLLKIIYKLKDELGEPTLKNAGQREAYGNVCFFIRKELSSLSS